MVLVGEAVVVLAVVVELPVEVVQSVDVVESVLLVTLVVVVGGTVVDVAVQAFPATLTAWMVRTVQSPFEFDPGFAVPI